MSGKHWRAMVALLFCSSELLAQGPLGNLRPVMTSLAPTEAQAVDLQLGEQRVLSSDNVRSYSEGTKGVVDVRLTKDSSQFVIVALKPGATTLLFLMMDGTERHYRITVTDPNAQVSQRSPLGRVELKDNIRLDFYFVQVSKNYRHQIGLGWPSSIAPTFSATVDLQQNSLESATAVVANQALPRLDMAQASGWAKLLRQAAVVAANGEKATFSGGGELNVMVQSALTTGVQKIPYGSVVDVEPNYDAKTGRIELRIHADISELDSDNGTGVPGRITSNLDTAVNLELGQSLILAGLAAKSERHSKSGLPVLSQIPILGALFGSHGSTSRETENIVLIVPSVVDAVTMQDRERVKQALQSYADFSGDLEQRLVPEPPPAAPKARKQGAP